MTASLANQQPSSNMAVSTAASNHPPLCLSPCLANNNPPFFFSLRANTMTVSPVVQQPPQFHGCMNCGPATTHLYCCLHAWPGIIHHNYSFVSQEFTSSTPRRTVPYKCDMAAGASSDEFLLQITGARTKTKKKKTKNLARPSPIPHAQEKNKPFGLSPLTLINLLCTGQLLVIHCYFICQLEQTSDLPQI